MNRVPALRPELAELARSPIVDHCGALVLERRLTPGLREPSPGDPTEFEALTNKVYVADESVDDPRDLAHLGQGIAFAEALAARLAGLGRPFRVALARQPERGFVNVRFYVRRSIPYFDDDPDAYEGEEIAYWDV